VDSFWSPWIEGNVSGGAELNVVEGAMAGAKGERL
jgi:hypothetical protein